MRLACRAAASLSGGVAGGGADAGGLLSVSAVAPPEANVTSTSKAAETGRSGRMHRRIASSGHLTDEARMKLR